MFQFNSISICVCTYGKWSEIYAYFFTCIFHLVKTSTVRKGKSKNILRSLAWDGSQKVTKKWSKFEVITLWKVYDRDFWEKKLTATS